MSLLLRSPVIIATPRTGSTVICRILGNIARHRWEHLNVLYEYFDPNPTRRIDYKIVSVFGNPTVVVDGTKVASGDDLLWTTQQQLKKLQNYRIDLLRRTGLYTLKIFPDHFNNQIYDYVREFYQPIYLERRDKFAQAISYLAMKSTRVTHYGKDDDRKVTKVNFSPSVYDFLRENIISFKKLKTLAPGPVLYYEDFVEAGGNQRALIDLLKIDGCDTLREPDPVTRPTTYLFKGEEIFANEQLWNRHRQRVIEELKRLDDKA